MDISEVRVKLVSSSQERLRAFCSVTLDNDFVIRDLKIIDGANGTFVAMPSRKLADRCPQCGHKNHLRARFCNDCGKKLNENRAKNLTRRTKLHADIAHPINAACRERIQSTVIEAFEEELEKSKQPGYQPIELDDYDTFDETAEEPASAPAAAADARPQKTGYPSGGYDELIAELRRDAAERRTPGPSTSTAAEVEEIADSYGSKSALPEPAAEPEVPVESKQDHGREDFGAGIL